MAGVSINMGGSETLEAFFAALGRRRRPLTGSANGLFQEGGAANWSRNSSKISQNFEPRTSRFPESGGGFCKKTNKSNYKNI